MIKTFAAAMLLATAIHAGAVGTAAAEPGVTDTEILIGDVEPLTGPPALLGV
ncbi:branched-chain amino acid ABC transporter substrate-binding protein, partial [Bradyrhizobium sp. Leo121]